LNPNLTVQDLVHAEKQWLEYVHSFRPNDDTLLPIGFFSGYYTGEIYVGSSYEKMYLQLESDSQFNMASV